MHGQVVLVGEADENTGPTAPQPLSVYSSSFNGLPRRLQQQPLLRIHRQRLTRRDAEELGVELRRVVEKSPLTHVARPGTLRVGVIKGSQIPAAIRRKPRDRVPALRHQTPQFLWRAGASRIAAGHSDNGDRINRLQLMQPAAHTLVFPERGAQRCHYLVSRHGHRDPFASQSGGPEMSADSVVS